MIAIQIKCLHVQEREERKMKKSERVESHHTKKLMELLYQSCRKFSLTICVIKPF